MKKIMLTLLMLSLMVMPLVAAEGLGDTLKSVGVTILDIGSLKFLNLGTADNYLFGFIRILIAVVIFTIVFMALGMIPSMQKSYAIVIGIIFAILSSIFIPNTVLAAMGGTYAGLFSFLLIGAPIAGVGYLIFATPTPSRWVAAMKFAACLFLLWLFNVINTWAIKLMGTGVN